REEMKWSNRLGRRDFVRLVGASVSTSAVSLVAPGCGSNSDSAGSVDRVLVIGAGAAGLTAANALTTAGIETVVLEARDRIGGRVWTDDVDGVPVDLGGMWIHGPAGDTAACILNHEGVGWKSAEFFGFDTRVFDAELGRYATGDERVSMITSLNAFDEAIPSLFDTLGPDATMTDAVTTFLDQEGLEGTARRHTRFGLLTQIELLAAQSAGDLSLISYIGDDEDDGGAGGGYAGGDNFPTGSYRTLIEALARGVDVRLNSVVSKIEYDTRGVTVETSNGTERGSHAVVTLPLGVLKAGSVEFSPALPADKRDAIELIDMAELEKVVLRYSEPFWQAPGSGNVLYLGATQGELPLIVDYTPFAGGEPTLVAFYCGDYGRSVASMSDEAIAGRAAAIVNEFTVTQGPEPNAVRVTRWKDDPFALGSYPGEPIRASVADVQAIGLSYQAMAAPVGDRLLFAGDGTTNSTVDGAIVSGIREAERLLDRQGQGVVLESGLLIAPGCNELA
ncbi:MAG: NAD(P)/FAD-dependent oxidoreductase, partial [Myxococcota bacterium]